MSRRTDAKELSDVRLELRCTAAERERIKALAKSFKTNMSDLVRRLIGDEERRQQERARSAAKWGGLS